jgi:hypothetical protein
MKPLITLLTLALILVPAFADSLKPQLFKDQWDNTIELDSSVQWLLFSHSRKGGEWIEQSMTNLDITDPASKQMLIVADISRMPGMITRMIAMPKMRKLPYPMAISRDAANTENWPRAGDDVSLYRLDRLKIVKRTDFKSQAELQQVLAEL